MMGKQQTAVEWLWAKATNGYLSPEDFDKAKQMEREQMEECGRVMYNNGAVNSGLKPSDYYTQTYGQ